LPSLQEEPSALFGFEQTPVAGLHVPALWHWSDAVQTTGFAPEHDPFWQVSVWVHAFPSLQVVPLALFGFEHTPVAGLQVPGVWHWPEAVQTTGFAPEQDPFWQVSVWVHAFPSLQDDPSALFGFEQMPVAGLHVPALWHWSEAEQVTGFAPEHAPFWQVSVCVHALPSLQEVPSALFGFEQTPVAGLHVPALWHWSDAVQTSGFAPEHAPF
jgi:hypothetical protein